ncbi:hypothetical protein EMCRGX_G031717 [Ephydatia muelleri]
MASRAYVASMTVAELTTELKQRGLSTKGRKKTLMERLEKAFDEEELNDPSSEEDSESHNGGQEAKTVDTTTAQSAETSRDSESMIVAIELGNRENLEVRTNEVVKKNDEQMIVAIHLNNPQELRVKEAEAKQDEPNSLGAWSQEQISEGTVTQDTSSLLRLAKCAKDTTANVCEAEPSGQLASKGQETEQKMEVETAEVLAPMAGDGHISQAGGGPVQCNSAVAPEGSAPNSSSPSTAGAPEVPSECPPPAPQNATLREGAVKTVVAPSPTTTPVDSSLPSATIANVQLEETALPTAHRGTYNAPRATDVPPSSGLPLVADPALHAACGGAGGELDGVGGGEVGHEEVSQGGAEGQIDVDVVVYAEEDEFSMFSTEADELQKFSTRGKNNAPVSSSRSSSHVQVASSRDRKIGDNSQADVVPELGQARKRDVVLEKNDQSAVKKRRISAPTTPGADKGEPHERKRRWGPGNKHKDQGVTTDISSDLLQEIIPAGIEKEMVREPSALEAVMSYGEDDCAEDGIEVTEKAAGNKEAASGGDERLREERHPKEHEGASQELETRRRIESRLKIKKEVGNAIINASGPRALSPPKNQPSHILHLENLTRPFTLMQLKELLTEDGPMVKDGFWTNKIKSHCIIVYETQDVAAATRKRLHGMKWPSTNPKLLVADFLTIEEVAAISDGELVIKEDASYKGRDVAVEEDHSTKPDGQITKTTSADSSTVVDASSSTTATVSGAKPEQPEKQEKAPSPATEKAAKTLDTLFRRTVAAPSIYWLPLSEAQANEKAVIEATKDAERQKRREEREKELCAIREKEEQERKEREKKMREEREKEQKLREERRARDDKDRKDQDKHRDRSHERRRQRSRSNSRPKSRSRSRDRRRR